MDRRSQDKWTNGGRTNRNKTTYKQQLQRLLTGTGHLGCVRLASLGRPGEANRTHQQETAPSEVRSYRPQLKPHNLCDNGVFSSIILSQLRRPN